MKHLIQIAKPLSKAEAEFIDLLENGREAYVEVEEEIRRDKEILADLEKFKADLEKRIARVEKSKAADKKHMSWLKERIPSEKAKIDVECDDELDKFGTTFSVQVVVDASFQASGNREGFGELEFTVSITNDNDGNKTLIECYQEDVATYPKRRGIDGDSIDFSAIEDLLPQWQLNEVKRKVIEVCNADESWWSY